MLKRYKSKNSNAIVIGNYDNHNINSNIHNTNNGNNNVLYMNQIFFHILMFVGFPAVLYFSSVAQSWRSRIWPRQVLTMEEWKSAKTKGRKRKNKMYIRYPVQMEAVSIVSSNCVFGAYCTTARFTQLPRTKFHTYNILKQLFVTYPKLQHIEIVGNCALDPSWQLDEHVIVILLNFWKLHAHNDNNNSTKQDKVLVFTNCNCAFLSLKAYDTYLENVHVIFQSLHDGYFCLYRLSAYLRKLKKISIIQSNCTFADLWHIFAIKFQRSEFSSLRDFTVIVENLYGNLSTENLDLNTECVMQLEKLSIIVKRGMKYHNNDDIRIVITGEIPENINLKEISLSNLFTLDSSFLDFVQAKNIKLTRSSPVQIVQIVNNMNQD